MGTGHTHAIPTSGNERSLWIALGLTTSFLIAEVIGGIVTGSLALISDAAHMFTDAAALAISLAAIRMPSGLTMRAGRSVITASKSSPRRSMRYCCLAWPYTSCSKRISASEIRSQSKSGLRHFTSA